MLVTAVSTGRSVNVVRETERKYEAGDGVRLPDPPGLLGLDAPDGPELQTLEAVYFDTPDLRLLRAGVTMRRRPTTLRTHRRGQINQVIKVTKNRKKLLIINEKNN